MPSNKPLALTGVMLFSLGVMGMLGPFGTDTYLPALPVIAGDLHVTRAQVSLTLSAFTIGMALGQLILGSLSDRIGRRPILLGGGTVITLAAIAASMAPSVEVLVGLCFAMGLVAAAGIVGGRAVVADLTQGLAAARPFAILGMTVSIGPIVGPIGGTLLMGLGGWRAIFIGLAVFAALATAGIFAFVPESLSIDKRHGGGLGTIARNAKRILTTRSFITYAVVNWLSFALIFAYISSSSFIVQNNLGLPPSAFAVVFGVNGVGMILSSFTTSQLVKRIAPRRILLAGVTMQVCAAVWLLTILVTGWATAFTVLPAMFVMVASVGFIAGPASAMAMVDVRFASGTALALMGSIQFLAASVSATLVGIISPNALLALTIVATGAVALVVTAVIIGTVSGRRASTPSTR